MPSPEIKQTAEQEKYKDTLKILGSAVIKTMYIVLELRKYVLAQQKAQGKMDIKMQ